MKRKGIKKFYELIRSAKAHLIFKIQLILNINLYLNYKWDFFYLQISNN